MFATVVFFLELQNLSKLPNIDKKINKILKAFIFQKKIFNF
jgi:hypothetical protein